MTDHPTLRRLIDLPGVADLERKALMKPAAQEPEHRAEFPDIDACSIALFGLTADQALECPRPADWDDIEKQPVAAQIAAFAEAGWNLTDNKRRPLRMFHQLNQQLWLAVRGVAGALPFHVENDPDASMASKLEREAARFRRR